MVLFVDIGSVMLFFETGFIVIICHSQSPFVNSIDPVISIIKHPYQVAVAGLVWFGLQAPPQAESA